MADFVSSNVRDDGVAILRITRPPMNALSLALLAELADAGRALATDARVKAVVVAGGERAFAAGFEISEFDDAARARDIGRMFRAATDSLVAIPRPVIAAVNGFALGGGCELALACHIRIASDKAKFGQPEVKLGTCPGYGGTQRLSRLIGKGRAIQLITTAEMIDAAEAYRIGLVNKVVSPDELMGAAVEMMKQILANGPLAVTLCMEAIDRGLEMSLEEGLVLEANHFGLLAATEDMTEGMKAFLEKRTPVFAGK